MSINLSAYLATIRVISMHSESLLMRRVLPRWVRMHACMCARMHAFMCVHMHAFMCVRISISMHV